MTPALTGALDYMPVAAAMPFGHNSLCETDVRHPPQNKGAAAMNILVRYAPSGPVSCAAAMALSAFSSCSPRLLILVVGLWCPTTNLVPTPSSAASGGCRTHRMCKHGVSSGS